MMGTGIQKKFGDFRFTEVVPLVAGQQIHARDISLERNRAKLLCVVRESLHSGICNFHETFLIVTIYSVADTKN